MTAPSATELPTAQPNVPANSRHPGPRAVPSVSSVLILPPGPIVDRHRRPQERLQAARRPPAYPNQARIIAPVTPSHPSAVLTPSTCMNRWIRAYTPFQTKPDAAPVRLIVRRVKPTPGSQLALFATYSYHGFITDRDGETLELEADHRRHAEVENTIRDLKYGVGLNHMPSGRFAANGAWLAVQVMAHNLARWTARIGLGERTVTTKTLRRRFFSLAGRLTRSARRLTLHLPRRWPWESQFTRALARLRAIPLPA